MLLNLKRLINDFLLLIQIQYLMCLLFRKRIFSMILKHYLF
jgi:hypothetical protein